VALSEVLWPQSCVSSDPRHHVWTNLLSVVKGKYIIRPTRPRKYSMRSSRLAL